MNFKRGQLVRVKNPIFRPTFPVSDEALNARKGSGSLGEVVSVTGDVEPALIWIRNGQGAVSAPYWDYELVVVAGPT